MNIQERQQRIIDAIAKPFRNKVFAEKNRFIRQQAERFDVLAPISDKDFAEHKENMSKIFEKYYKITIKTFSEEVAQNVLRKSHWWHMERKASLWEYLFGKWVSERGATAAQETATTTRSDIRQAIKEAQTSEQDIGRSQIVSNILKARGLSAFRADTIARTETGMAASYSSVETAKNISANTGVKIKKRWIPALDDRTRFSHASMAGSPAIGMEAKFIVNGERLDRPRDPAGSAGNVINCRCAVIFEEA